MCRRPLLPHVLVLALLTAWCGAVHASGGAVALTDGRSPAAADADAGLAGACVLQPGALQTISYTWTAPDAWSNVAWRIPRSQCVACPPGQSLAPNNVALRVRWLGACSASVRVSVVAATESSPGCPAPDTSLVYCPPASFPLVGTASGGVTYVLPLSACCIPGDAFLRLQFLGFDGCVGFSPGLYRSDAACSACTQYFNTAVSQPLLADLCTSVPQFLWFQLDADCCTVAGVEDGAARSPATLAVLGAPSSRARLRVTLAGPEIRTVALDVYDVLGRHVRTLARGAMRGGSQVIEWDGRSDSGEPAPVGVYRALLRAGDASASASVILLR